MSSGSYNFNTFKNKDKEMERLNLQAKILAEKEVAFLRKSGLTDGMKILDLGCGLGETIHLLKNNFSNLKITGVDSNIEFLAECKIKHNDAVKFIQSDVYDLSHISEEFDFIYSRFLFQHLVMPEKVLDEVYRILKPQGIFVILDVDDSFYNLKLNSNNLVSFLEIAEKSQIKNGGDRRVGHKLKDYFLSTNYKNIISIEQKIKSKDIGLKNFLDITTGLKLEHINADQKILADQLVQSIYAEALGGEVEGEITLFGVSGQKV